MAGNSALGGFVEGLQGGISHRQQSLRNKKIDRMLDQESEIQAMAIKGQQGDINSVRAQKGLDPMDFSQFGADQDPYSFKLGDFFKPRKLWQNFKNNVGIGGDSAAPLDSPSAPAQANQAAIEEMTSGASASSMGMQGNVDDLTALAAADGGMIRRYAEGGAVLSAEEQLDQLRRTRQGDAARASVAERHEVGRRTGDPDRIRPDKNREWTRRERVNRAGGSSSKKMGLDTAARRATGGGGRVAQAGRAAGKAAAIATPTMMAGSAIKSGFTDTDEYRSRYEDLPALDFLKSEEDDWEITTAAKDLGYRALGAFQDLGDNLLSPGKLFGAEDESPVAPEKRAAIAASDIGAEKPKPDVAAQANPNQAPPRAAAPQQPQPPQTRGPDQLLSKDTPIAMPDEMPTMSTEEWVAYRAANVENMLLRGMTLPEAHDAITNMQQKGFLNYGTQALQLLAAGDAPRAAMALKAAYQYFPNGVDVRFGITKDAAGQPALVAMGVDEKTGDPVPQGTMVLNGERLAVMMEHMTNPEAFRMWTKDWREFEQDLRKYYEIEKPQAQSENQYRADMGAAAIARADADYAAVVGGGGLKRSDLDRNSAEFRKALGEMGLLERIPRPQQTYLSRIMSALMMYHGLEQNEAIDEVMNAYDNGSVPDLLSRYGLAGADEQGN